MEVFYIGQIILINNEEFKIVNALPIDRSAELKHIKSGKVLIIPYEILEIITREVKE